MPFPLGRNLSIRTRIALSIFAVSSGALVLMALAVFVIFRKTISDNLDDTVRLRAGANLALVDPTSPPRLSAGSGGPGAGGGLVRLYAPDGAVTAGAPDIPAPVAAERALAARALRGAAAMATVSYGDTAYRVLASPVRQEGRTAAVLITGLPVSEIAETLALLRLTLLIVVPITSLVLGLSAFMVARRALRPVHRITAAARTIAAGDLRRRIEGVPTRDEVGELAETFNAMIGQLEGHIERERRFTADASHELRTPLTAMDAAIEVTLSHERSTGEYRETLLALRAQTGRMTRIVRQLLMLSRFDADAARIERVPVVLPELLDAVRDAFVAHHPAVTIVKGSHSAGAVIEGDPEMLARAFTNVLENAAAHAGATATVYLSVRGVSDAVIVTIRDDGPGMSPELRATAFQRFRRGDASRSRGGSGLGLAIVESIVRLHGGTVTLDSSPAGTTVRFTFPRRADA